MWGHFGKSDLAQTLGRPETKQRTVGLAACTPIYLYWPPLKHPRCFVRHQPISLLEAETVLIRGGRSMEHIWLKAFWVMNCSELEAVYRIYSIVIMNFHKLIVDLNFPKLIADITMQNAFSGSMSVRGIDAKCERHPRNVCLTFPGFLATNLSILACPKLLTSQKILSQSPGSAPLPLPPGS